MTVVRLTNSKRDAILNGLLTFRFKADAQKLINDFAQLASDVDDDVYDKIERKKMELLPKGWLPTDKGITVRFGDSGRDDVRLAFNGHLWGEIARLGAEPVDVPERRHPYSNRYGVCKVYDSGHPLSERYTELKNRLGVIEEQIVQVKSIARATMNSVSTIKRLVEVWPEVTPFVGVYTSEERQLPTVPREQLNNLIGLPADELELATGE